MTFPITTKFKVNFILRAITKVTNLNTKNNIGTMFIVKKNNLYKTFNPIINKIKTLIMTIK